MQGHSLSALDPLDAVFGLDHARAAAEGTRCNPRNLEYLWYPFWTRALSQLAYNVDRDSSIREQCIVAPQFPLWRTWTRDDTQLGDIAMLSGDEDNEMDVEEGHIGADPINRDDNDPNDKFPLWQVWMPNNTQPGTGSSEEEEMDIEDHSEYSINDHYNNNSDNNSIHETPNIRTCSCITDLALVYLLKNNTVNSNGDEEETFLINQEFIVALIESNTLHPKD
jgi:hypothetical protein